VNESRLAAARDVAARLEGTAGRELDGQTMRQLVEEVARLRQSLRECQADLVAVHGVLPAWCSGATLAERVASVVVYALGRDK
jgi:hypothetical protein